MCGGVTSQKCGCFDPCVAGGCGSLVGEVNGCVVRENGAAEGQIHWDVGACKRRGREGESNLLPQQGCLS